MEQQAKWKEKEDKIHKKKEEIKAGKLPPARRKHCESPSLTEYGMVIQPQGDCRPSYRCKNENGKVGRWIVIVHQMEGRSAKHD